MKSPKLLYLVSIISLSLWYLFMYPNPGFTETTDYKSFTLCLKTPGKKISQGEIFTVDLCLDNPEKTSFDSLLVWLHYDPKILQVLEIDYDPQNLIIKEMEIQQAEFEEQFSLPLIATNRIDNSCGEIDFRIETVSSAVVVEGVFARIIFKANAFTRGAQIRFRFNRWGKDPNTAILRDGKDVLGRESFHRDGTRNVILPIQP